MAFLWVLLLCFVTTSWGKWIFGKRRGTKREGWAYDKVIFLRPLGPLCVSRRMADAEELWLSLAEEEVRPLQFKRVSRNIYSS